MARSIEWRLPRRPRVFRSRWHRPSHAARPHRCGMLRMSLFALLALVLSSKAIAQSVISEEAVDSPGLVIEAIAGWDDTISQSMPIPVSFLIGNYSDRMIEGQLTLSDPMNGYEVVLGEIVVSPGGTRRFSSIQNLSDWFLCVATLHDGGRVLWRRELALQTSREFSPSINFALFVDNSGRNLHLPGAVSGAAMAETPIAGVQGRPIRCLSAKAWQVPNHPGPLVVIKAMIFPERAEEADLNRVQWRAVADWMCQGGAVFVHKESRKIIKRLIDSAPLDHEPPAQSGEFQVRRVGLGAIYEYARPLFASEGKAERQQIARTIAMLTGSQIRALIDSGRLHRREAGRAEVNRMLVVAFFGGYMLLSGVVALLLFRLSRRWITIYTFTVVVGASVFSGLLGGYLRLSRGDLHWMTVTQAAAGGLVQYGRLDVQSAGGRNTQVAITGEHPDLQFQGAGRPYYHWNRRRTDYAPFTWQPNLAAGEDDTYQIHVPMTPWGRRRLQATAFQREPRRLDFELEFEPRDLPAGERRATAGASGMPSGVFSLKLANHLPFDMTDCWLVISVTSRSESGSASMPLMQNGGIRFEDGQLPPGALQSAAPGGSGLVDVYQIHRVSLLKTDATYEEQFEARFQALRENWDLGRSWDQGRLVLPRIKRLGAASAWIIGRVEHSPIMAIDENRSDFVPHDEFHIFVQEIRPEDMPDAALFLGIGQAAAEASRPDPR